MSRERERERRVHRHLLGLLVAACVVPSLSGQTTAADSSEAAAAAYRDGQAAFSRHDVAGAQAAFERAVRLAPHNEPAHSALGLVLLQQGKAAQAAHELEIAHAMGKADLGAEMNLALAYQQLGLQAKAVPLFADAASGARLGRQAMPASMRAAYAQALAATGKLPQAEAEMRSAVNAEPKSATLRGYLGSLYAQQKEWARAESEFRAEVAIEPGSAIAHLRLGLALEAQTERGALPELAQAAQLAPQQVPIQLAWGKAVAASGDDEHATRIFEHVLSLQPNSLEATDQLAQAYQRTRRVPEAIELFQKVLAADPNYASALTNLGMAYTQLQRAKEAIPFLQRAIAIDPKSITTYQDLAAAYVQLSQFADAAAQLRLALQLAPSSGQLHYNLGLALKSQDDTAGAIPELETAEKLDATGPEAPYLLGILYLQAAHYPEASRELQTSLRLRPEDGDVWATLGSVYNKLEQLPEAVAALQEAIKQLPQQPDPHLTLAAVLAKQGHMTEAAEERKEAATLMRVNMNRQRAEVATNSGRTLLQSGDVTGAMQKFEDALSYDSDFAEAHRGRASVFDTQGKPEEAAAERQKAGQDVTTNPNLR